MQRRFWVTLVLLTAPLVAAATARAAEPCVFETYAPSTVTPYSEEDILSYGTYSFMRGVQLYIPARQGLTSEWLRTSIERALLTRPGTPSRASNALSCSPNVKDVQVAVTSAGNGFWVTLTGRDEKSAQALLKWARSYVARAKVQARTERVTR